MSNLTLKADLSIVGALKPILPEIEELVTRWMGATKPNVMLVQMSGSPATATLYAEFLYQSKSSRPPEFIREFAGALSVLISTKIDGSFAFRGFPLIEHALVASDFELKTGGR